MLRHRLYALLFSSILVLLFAACTQGSTETETPDPPTPPNIEPGTPELTANTWNEFTPEGETTCANGSQYKYYVYPGAKNKVVIDFEGGGACWDDLTCSLPIDAEDDGEVEYYVDRVVGPPNLTNGGRGIYNKTSPDNPIGDWYHVYVNYCTADIHLGDSVQTYTDPGDGTTFEVQHKGRTNVQAVLDWVFESFEAPETIFVTGCSAGAYGSITYMPKLQARYPDADIYQMGDCGAGVIPETFADAGLGQWNIAGALPALPDTDFSGEPSADFATELYAAVGQQYPESVVSQYNSAADGVQIFFYEAQGGDPSAWSGALQASLREIGATTENFYAYTSALDVDGNPNNGTAHCVITRPEFYTLDTNGVSFASWVGDLVNGRTDELENVSPPAGTAALN